ncbi:MAG: sialate O-acetylesterase [Gammaproteobacteria bacterium]|nr:sialate O-acetylesterase [Gammaproteobacteria bacterium]
MLVPALILVLVPGVLAESHFIPVFILAGQSNAVGYGVSWQGLTNFRIEREVSLWYTQPHPLRPASSGRWVPLAGEQHRSVPGVGSEISIGRLSSSQLRSPVGIIKIAFNGTALGQSSKPDWNVHSDELYSLALSEIRRALKVAPGKAERKLAGLLWVQGESDAKDGDNQPTMAERYEENLMALIGGIRGEFKRLDMPVVIAVISVPAVDGLGRRFGYRNIIREAQRSIARSQSNTSTIDIDDLPKQTDGLHFNAQGQSEIGKRFFATWLNLARRWPQASTGDH